MTKVIWLDTSKRRQQLENAFNDATDWFMSSTNINILDAQVVLIHYRDGQLSHSDRKISARYFADETNGELKVQRLRAFRDAIKKTAPPPRIIVYSGEPNFKTQRQSVINFFSDNIFDIKTSNQQDILRVEEFSRDQNQVDLIKIIEIHLNSATQTQADQAIQSLNDTNHQDMDFASALELTAEVINWLRITKEGRTQSLAMKALTSRLIDEFDADGQKLLSMFEHGKNENAISMNQQLELKVNEKKVGLLEVWERTGMLLNTYGGKS